MLQQHIEQVDQKHEDGHVRLRQDVRSLEVKVEALEAMHSALSMRFAERAAKPVDLEDVRVSPKMAAAVIAALVSIAVSQWGSTWGLRTDLREFKVAWDGIAKVQAAQIDTLKKDYEALLREQALQRVRFEETRNTISKMEGMMTATTTKGKK